MKKLSLYCLTAAAFILLSQGINASAQTPKIKVAFFAGHGGAETCVMETEAALKMDSTLDVHKVFSKEIAAGILDQVDVLVFPGGGGSTEYLNLGGTNAEIVKEFVRKGGGVVGICAGAYLLSDTPDYACLRLSSAEAYDIEHDHRGRGISKVTLTDEGKKLFPEAADQDTLFIMYYEGPVIRPIPALDRTPYETLAVMESDVAVEEGVPSGMTNGKPFLYTNTYGEGKVVAVIGHPEATPGMQWMLPRLVHHASGRDVTHGVPKKFVRPDFFNREILMDKARRDYEEKAYDTYLYGSGEEVIETLDSLMVLNSWSNKRWIQGLLYHSSPAVRKAAISHIGDAFFKMYEADLITLRKTDLPDDVRNALEEAISKLSCK